MLKHDYVWTEHILLGVLREEEGVAAQALAGLDVAVERVRDQVVALVGSGEEALTGQLPFTPRTKTVLELALREALSLRHNYIGTEHILLGLASENGGLAARILLDLGADPDKIRHEVVRLIPEAEAAGRGRSSQHPSLVRRMPAPTGADVHGGGRDALSAEDLDNLIEQLISEKRVVVRRLRMLQADLNNVRAERDERRRRRDEPDP